VRVSRKWPLAQDICGLELQAMSEALPPFEAGAHIDLHLPGPGGELVRQYSLCSIPGNTPYYRIAVLRETNSRGGSERVHTAVAEGDQLRISAPINHFALAANAPHHLLLAGGIGITPLLAMAEQLHSQGRAFTLHHAARARAHTPFLDHIAASGYAGQVVYHFGDSGPADRLDFTATLRQAPEGSHLYVCGPQRFIDGALHAARALGWAQDRLHHEYFSADPIDTTEDGSFELEIASTGQVIPVRPDQTTLQALLGVGIDVPSS
jgi:vanillate O-demethylase ferredoxin subunit